MPGTVLSLQVMAKNKEDKSPHPQRAYRPLRKTDVSIQNYLDVMNTMVRKVQYLMTKDSKNYITTILQFDQNFGNLRIS